MEDGRCRRLLMVFCREQRGSDAPGFVVGDFERWAAKVGTVREARCAQRITSRTWSNRRTLGIRNGLGRGECSLCRFELFPLPQSAELFLTNEKARLKSCHAAIKGSQ